MADKVLGLGVLLLSVFCVVLETNAADVVSITCSQNSDCTPENAVCKSGNCACDETTGYIVDPTNAEQCALANGADCSSDATICNAVTDFVCGGSSTCECKANYVVANNLCSKVIGGSCQQSTDCSNNVANSECGNDNMCKCMMNYQESPSTGACDKMLGSSCNDDGDCTVMNSMCASNNMCSCKSGYMETNAAGCAKIYDMDCSSDASICNGLVNSECAAGDSKCKCTANYEITSVYLCKLRNSQACTADADCASNNCEGEAGTMTCMESNSAQSVMLSVGLLSLSVLVLMFQHFF